MEKRLYVGGLSYDTPEATLKDVFSQAGTVESAHIIMDRSTNQSKGFGFVEMSSEEEAKKAIELLDGKELDGRTLTVNIARPKEDNPQGGDRRGNSRGFGGNGHRNRNRW